MSHTQQLTAEPMFHNEGAVFHQGRFHNTRVAFETDAANLWQVTKAYLGAKRAAPRPDVAVPLCEIDEAELARDEARLYRLGHSTVLIRLDGKWLLTDPVFSERASPVQWAGPKRFHDSPLTPEQLPFIDAVILSHDHYDHLDKAAIKALDAKVDQFIAPLGVGRRLRAWGVAAEKITELDWWQGINLGSIRLTATPSQHFSGRGLWDKNHTLWASWVLAGKQARVFFSGDSGYFEGFREIGEHFGPFDITLMETGAYNELWADIHMHPQQSLQAHLDVAGMALLPIHNGTFDLALHDWYEPLERIEALARRQGVVLLTPRFGEPVSLRSPKPTNRWWRELMPEQDLAIAALTEEPGLCSLRLFPDKT
ncbi:MBL fold metallo-hydrolase [Shewanella sedimentimangrovi]|nr:MBL fold metallo-hydrolase [Shewanella sedimentimangrovi]